MVAEAVEGLGEGSFHLSVWWKEAWRPSSEAGKVAVAMMASEEPARFPDDEDGLLRRAPPPWFVRELWPIVGLEWVGDEVRPLPLDPVRTRSRILVHLWDPPAWTVRSHPDLVGNRDAPWSEWMDARGASQALARALESVPGDVEVLATAWWKGAPSGLVKVALSAWDRDGCWTVRPGLLAVPVWVERSLVPVVDVLEVMAS